MANPHSSVAYVEPNYVFSGLTAAANDGETYDRAPDLEDYCIALDVMVELSSRYKTISDNMSDENKVIVMTYTDGGEGKSNVRFMSGTKIGGYSKTDSGEYSPKLEVPNVLTDYYADMYIEDLVDYGTTEMLGIKSVDIKYNSTCVPIIDIKFTDVRGMSIFQPSQLNRDLSFNGIRGFSKDNIAQSFFQAFFTIPPPKFTVTLKGFYGDPVSYQVMCNKFETSFDSVNGYFDVDTSFIGYAYSYMSDVSLNALLAAPYSDYKGEEYWDSQVAAERFVIPDKNGQLVAMPKLFDIRKTIETLSLSADEKSLISASEGEDTTHEVEIESLNKLRGAYTAWYKALYTECCEKYGKDYCYRYGGENDDDDYEMVIIMTNGENIDGGDLSKEYTQFSEGFRNLTGKLLDAIDEYNSSSSSHRKMPSIAPEFKYPRVKVFKEVWINDKTRKYMFDGFHSENTLPKKRTIDVVFGSTEENQQKVLKKLYNDGKYQYIDAFVIDLDYTGIGRRIKALTKDAVKKDNDEIKKRKALNRHMYEKMGWYPTVENFTKIVMAHLETLMAMMYDVANSTKERTVESLGVGKGDDGLVDINQYDEHVAPFPRLTILTTDEDGYTKSEDTWAGNFTDGEGFREVDVINGLFNGAAKIRELEELTNKVTNNINTQNDNESEGTTSVVPMPITSYDYLVTSNPYGKDVMKDIKSFAGSICLRMFGVLALSHFRVEKGNSWESMAEKLGVIEANNFNRLNKITDIDIMTAISEGGTIKNGNDILELVTANTENALWGSDKPLFVCGEDLWLTRYCNDKRGIYPLFGLSFKDIDDVYRSGKSPLENKKVLTLEPCSTAKANYSRIVKMQADSGAVMNTCHIVSDFKYILDLFNSGRSNNVQEYIDTIDTLSNSVISDYTHLDVTFMSSENMSFNYKPVYGVKLLPSSDVIPIKDEAEQMYPGDKNDNPYFFDDVNYRYEAMSRAVNSYTITECFGFKFDGERYVIDNTTSLFSMDNAGSFSDTELALYFIMGIDSIDYAAIKSAIEGKTYAFIPNIAVLQMGAAMHHFYGGGKRNFYDEFKTLTNTPRPKGFEVIEETISKMSPYTKIGIMKHFANWKTSNTWRLKQLLIEKKDNGKVFVNKHKSYEKRFKNGRMLFRHDSGNIAALTNDLFSVVCLAKISIGAADITPGVAGSTDNKKMSLLYSIKKGVATAYLDSFMKTLRELNGTSSDEENGGPTTLANSPSQTTDDMKIELYRYLKQLYDKWVSNIPQKAWNFDNFFGEGQKGNQIGNNFFFIDSFYNKIGNKLLMNPSKLSEILKLTISSMDTNVTLYNFLSQIYGHHRCMIKCVQNFKNLAEGITNIFKPVPYTMMRQNNLLSDFVVIYTYESSKNLNSANGEYKDDGFMLSEEYETPMPIKSRSDETKFYRIPAFGVSYGRQYQSYFTAVNVDMTNPVMTEQAIIAKHNILAASRNKVYKGSQAQDLYDIFSNQSYKCTLEMMGCAYVQPLMYFVLLNVPFFRGSYLISEVSHSMKPGEMKTHVTGIRMSKYCNRLVEDIFTDQMDETIEPGEYNEDRRYENADTCNDCGYKTFPIGEDSSNNITMSKDEMENANSLMRKLIGLGVPEKSAAGIVGNMAIETGPTENNPYRFNPQTLNPNDSGFVAAGLCQWNDSYYGLQQMLKNDSQTYGHNDDKKYTWHYTPNKAKEVRKLLAKTNADYQCKFIVDSLKNNNYAKEKKLWAKLTGATSPRDAAHIFCNGKAKYAGYENPNPKYAFLSDRMDWADKVYNNYKQTPIEPSKDPSPEKKVNDPTEYTKMFFNSIQKSINATASYKCELKGDFKGESVKITTNGGGDKLAVLFDIILNSEDYYVHVKRIEWLINNAPSEAPRALRVVVAEKVQSRVILIGSGNSKNGNYDSTSKFNGDECNEKLMQSLSKKYGSNLNLFKKECPQFSNVKDDVFNKYKPNSCGSLTSGREISTSPDIKATTSGGTIKRGKWNVSDTIAWFKTYSRDDYNSPCKSGSPRGKNGCKSLCATYVEKAIANGGLPLMKCGGKTEAATNLHYRGILTSNGFDFKYKGTCTCDESGRRAPSNFKLEPGDVCILGNDIETGGKGGYHACLWTGSEWYSDYNQHQKMSPYGCESGKYVNGSMPYFIYRYNEKK